MAEISIRELAEQIAELVGFDGEIEVGHLDAERPASPEPRCEPRAVSSSASKARTPLRDGPERTIAWYREHAGATAGAQA